MTRQCKYCDIPLRSPDPWIYVDGAYLCSGPLCIAAAIAGLRRFQEEHPCNHAHTAVGPKKPAASARLAPAASSPSAAGAPAAPPTAPSASSQARTHRAAGGASTPASLSKQTRANPHSHSLHPHPKGDPCPSTTPSPPWKFPPFAASAAGRPCTASTTDTRGHVSPVSPASTPNTTPGPSPIPGKKSSSSKSPYIRLPVVSGPDRAPKSRRRQSSETRTLSSPKKPRQMPQDAPLAES